MEPNRSPELELILRCARILVWEFELQERLTRYRAAAETFGLPGSSKLSLKETLQRVYGQDRHDVLVRLRSAVARGEPAIHHFRVQVRRDQPPLWVENHIEVVRDGAGRIERVRGVMIDITSHKQALAALTAADQRKDEFIATLGHELRSPLTAIGTAAQVLKATLANETQSGRCVEIIRRQAAHLGRLVEDLLDVSRAVRDRLEIKREVLELQLPLRGAVTTVEGLVNQHRHRLRVALPEESVLVEADPVRLAQVFENILTNAVKYTPSGGTIDVELERSGEWAVVRIRDCGVGLTAEDLALVFEPFYQVGASLTRAHGGLGIGLALVRRIVQLHSGTVHVISAGPGCGCEFIVRLPCLNEAGLVPTADQPAAGLPLDAVHTRRILVADDEMDAAESLALGLRMCGHEVVVAFDGAEAVRVAEEFHPQVALIDLSMPILPGHEVACELRRRDWALEQGIFIIALTGWPPSSIQGRIDMSVFDFQIRKPTELDTVSRLVAGQPSPRKQIT